MNSHRMEAAEEQQYNYGMGRNAVGGVDVSPPYGGQEGLSDGMGFKPCSGHPEYGDNRGNVDRTEEPSWRKKNVSQQPPLKDERGGGPFGGPHHGGFPGHYSGDFKQDYDRQGSGPDDRRRDAPPRDSHNTDDQAQRPRRIYIGKSLAELEKQGFS